MLMAKNKPLSEKHLQHSYSGGVALTLVICLSYLCINLTGKIAAIFFSAAMLDIPIIKDFSLSFIIGTAISLILSVTMLSPLRLNIKAWYQRTISSSLPVTAAFSYFTEMKKYLWAVIFCVTKFGVIFATYLVPIIPSIILAGILSYLFGRSNLDLGSSFGILAIITIVLFVLGIIFAIYFSIDYFFADFIFIKKIQRNPFKALLLSRKLARQNKSSLYLAIAASLPYYLLCIFIVTIPFMAPIIRTRFAFYADEILSKR